jgi:hypothetical protein
VTDDAAETKPESPLAGAAEAETATAAGSGAAPAPEDAPGETGETGDLVFDTLWGRVLEAWDEEKPHGALLDYALRAQRLPDLAGRYRALVDDPEKGARAKKKIDGIVVAATQMMLSTKTPKLEKPPPYLTWIAFGVFLLVMGLLAYAMSRR